MNANGLIKFLSIIHPLPPEFVEAVKTAVKPVIYPKGHYLVQAQMPSAHLYFLESGFAAAFRYERKKKVVTDFWQAGEMIVSPRSFFEQFPTDEIIELAVESTVLSISYHAFSDLMYKFSAANGLARNLVVHHYDRCEQRIIDIHTMDTWERYLKLLRTYPGIELKTSQEMIASYLNITPQSLSRMKAMHH